MKRIRHFIGDCIRLVKKIWAAAFFYFYRKVYLPGQIFLKKYFPGLVYIRTSGADIKSYRKICLLAANDDSVFETFRVHEDYAYNLGCYTNKIRGIFLDIINRDYPDLLKYSKKFEESEKFGGPETYDCGFGKFSDPTIRYIKTIGDIRNIFGALDNLKIIEIGVGYGGQCKIISDVFNFASYTMVDLKEVLPLAKRYLINLNVQKIIYLPPDEVPALGDYDLIISNFAFAECERFVQQDYIDKVLRYAKRGFIIYNFDTHPCQQYDPVRPYRREEITKILSKYHKLKILQDYPHPDHCNPFVIIWDDTAKQNV